MRNRIQDFWIVMAMFSGTVEVVRKETFRNRAIYSRFCLLQVSCNVTTIDKKAIFSLKKKYIDANDMTLKKRIIFPKLLRATIL